MQELNMIEIGLVSGAGGMPASGTLARPTRGESELGKKINDLFGTATAFGSWLGIKVWDLTHSTHV